MQASIDAPFEICPSSTIHPETSMKPFPSEILKDAPNTPINHRTNKAIGLVICCSIACFLAILYFLSNWQMLALIPDASNEEASTKIDGWSDLGMVLLDIQTSQAAAQYHVSEMGVYVLAVLENGVAQKAGFHSGDQILLVDAEVISSAADLNTLLFDGSIKKLVEFTIRRNKKESILEVSLPPFEGGI